MISSKIRDSLTSEWDVEITSISSSRRVTLPEEERVCVRPSITVPATEMMSAPFIVFAGDTRKEERFLLEILRAEGIEGSVPRGDLDATTAIAAGERKNDFSKKIDEYIMGEGSSSSGDMMRGRKMMHFSEVVLKKE